MRRLTILAAILTAACAHPAQLVVPLRYSPSENFTSNKPDSVSARLVVLDVAPLVDARAIDNKAVVGENHERALPRPVLATSSVSDFATDVLRRCLGEWGLRLGSGGAVLHGEITNLLVTEDFTYATAVTMRFHLERDGRTIWEGIITGDAHQWGRSFSPENYDEEISGALKRTFARLVDAPGFQAALAR